MGKRNAKEGLYAVTKSCNKLMVETIIASSQYLSSIDNDTQDSAYKVYLAKLTLLEGTITEMIESVSVFNRRKG